MNLQVAILAGGLGSRLYPLTQHIPKSLVEVAGKPFIVHQIELLRRNQINRLVLCLGYRGEMVRNFLGDGRSLGVHIDYVFDGLRMLGTAGAVKKALPSLDDAFFVLYGDSYLDINFQEVQSFFMQSGKSALMTVYRNHGRWDESNVLFENGRIVHYEKSNTTLKMEHIDFGLSLFRKEAFDRVPADESYDLAILYQRLIHEDALAGFESHQTFYEIGSYEGLERTRIYLSKNKS